MKQFLLGACSGLVTLLLSSLRMLLILYNTYNRRQMAVFCVLTVAVGLWVYTRGLWVLLPIVATVQSYLAHNLYSVKRSITRNLLFWGDLLHTPLRHRVRRVRPYKLHPGRRCIVPHAPRPGQNRRTIPCAIRRTNIKTALFGAVFSSSLFAEIFVQFPYQHFAVDAMHHAGFLQRFTRRRGASDAEHPLFKEYRRRVHVAFDNLLDRHIFCDLCHR